MQNSETGSIPGAANIITAGSLANAVKQFTENKPSGSVSMPLLCDLWNMLADVPVDQDDMVEESFLFFPVGTDRQDIWHWFESCHPDFLVGEAGSYIDGSHKYRSV